MGISGNIVAEIGQVKGGHTYIEVICLNGQLSIRTIRVVGVPYLESGHSHSNWFGRKQGGIFSLKDLNVIPNFYNDHSMWIFNTEVMNYLKGLAEDGGKGVQEYLNHLSHHKRGATFFGNPTDLIYEEEEEEGFE